jgi:hypothetical protein
MLDWRDEMDKTVAGRNDPIEPAMLSAMKGLGTHAG